MIDHQKWRFLKIDTPIAMMIDEVIRNNYSEK
jgi:hypothetical protein